MDSHAFIHALIHFDCTHVHDIACVRYGAWRVNGVLSVARAFGHRKLKQWVIGTPDIRSFDLHGDESYLVMACDGLWDVLTPEKVRVWLCGSVNPWHDHCLCF